VQQRATLAILSTQLRRRSTQNEWVPVVVARRGNSADRPAQGSGPFHHFHSTSRCVKGRCGTSLRFVSSLGRRPPLDPPRLSGVELEKAILAPESALELPRDNPSIRPVPNPTVTKDSPAFGRTSCPSQPRHEFRNRRRTDGFSNREPLRRSNVGDRYRDGFRTPFPRPAPGRIPADRQNEAWGRNKFRPTTSGTRASRQALWPMRTGPSDPRRMRHSCLVECVKDLAR
jgi:hypothetical protein